MTLGVITDAVPSRNGLLGGSFLWGWVSFPELKKEPQGCLITTRTRNVLESKRSSSFLIFHEGFLIVISELMAGKFEFYLEV